MTLKKKMQKRRNGDVKKITNTEIRESVMKVKNYFFNEQKEYPFKKYFVTDIFWIDHQMFLGNSADRKNAKYIVSNEIIYPENKEEFWKRLEKKLKKEGIIVQKFRLSWALIVELS